MSSNPAARPVTVRGTTIGTGRPKVIVPLTARTPDELLARAATVAGVAPDVVEWRIDHLLAGGSGVHAVVDAGRRLRKALGALPLLATVRTAAEGGEQALSDDEYTAVYRAVLGAGLADLVDVEVTRGPDTVRELTDLAHAGAVAVVASHHDFDATPAQEEIERLLLQMAGSGADICKLAVMPHDPGDVLALLAATWAASQATDRPLITMSMAEAGVVSRLAGGVFGSAATFAMVGYASAPGQVDITDLRAALALVHPA